MKEFLNKIFNSEHFKKAMINLLYCNPRLTGADYFELSKLLRETKNANINKEIQLQTKKASLAL
jgi:hypothetical protein